MERKEVLQYLESKRFGYIELYNYCMDKKDAEASSACITSLVAVDRIIEELFGVSYNWDECLGATEGNYLWQE